MKNPSAVSLTAMERQRIMFDHLLDLHSTGATIHLVANLKAAYLLAIGLYRKGGYQGSFRLIKESEAEINRFLKSARSRMALFL